jgi:hypothetical protein
MSGARGTVLFTDWLAERMKDPKFAAAYAAMLPTYERKRRWLLRRIAKQMKRERRKAKEA